VWIGFGRKWAVDGGILCKMRSEWPFPTRYCLFCLVCLSSLLSRRLILVVVTRSSSQSTCSYSVLCSFLNGVLVPLHGACAGTVLTCSSVLSSSSLVLLVLHKVNSLYPVLSLDSLNSNQFVPFSHSLPCTSNANLNQLVASKLFVPFQ
jgi:hypothetical protein